MTDVSQNIPSQIWLQMLEYFITFGGCGGSLVNIIELQGKYLCSEVIDDICGTILYNLDRTGNAVYFINGSLIFLNNLTYVKVVTFFYIDDRGVIVGINVG